MVSQFTTEKGPWGFWQSYLPRLCGKQIAIVNICIGCDCKCVMWIDGDTLWQKHFPRKPEMNYTRALVFSNTFLSDFIFVIIILRCFYVVRSSRFRQNIRQALRFENVFNFSLAIHSLQSLRQGTQWIWMDGRANERSTKPFLCKCYILVFEAHAEWRTSLHYNTLGRYCVWALSLSVCADICSFNGPLLTMHEWKSHLNIACRSSRWHRRQGNGSVVSISWKICALFLLPFVVRY